MSTVNDSGSPHISSAQLRLSEKLLIGVSVAVVAASVLMSQPLQSANDRSRWCTVWSLVERQTYQIDEIDRIPQWSTIDKVWYGANENEEKHFYSSKPPLLSTLVAGLYAIERVTLGYGLFTHTHFVTRLLLLVANVFPLLLALCVLRKTLAQLTVSPGPRLFVLAVAGFGSMLNPYYSTLNNHTPAAVCVVFCIAAVVRLSTSTARNPGRILFSLGFFAALTSCFELPAALLGLLTFAFALRINLRQTWTHFVPAALIPLSAFFVTNAIATGGIRPFYTYYGTEVYEFVHEGVPSYWMHPQDLDSNTESTATYLFHCVLGHHGILSLTPVFVLTVIGWCYAAAGRTQRRQLSDSDSSRKGDRALRLVTLSGGLLTLAVLGFYLTRTQNYNYGGNSVALRWLLWLTPFWWIGMLLTLERWLPARLGRLVTQLLLFVSVVSVTVSLSQPWRPSWLYNAMRIQGWIDYRTRTPEFDPPRSSVIRNIPDDSETSATWTTIDGRSLTIQRMPDSPVSDRSADSSWLRVIQSDATGISPPDLLLEIDADALQNGADISDWLNRVLIETDAGEFSDAPSALIRDLRYRLRGIPVARPYVAQGQAWRKWPWRPELAYEIERAAAQVTIRSESRGRLIYRCEIAYCDEVPFGVIEWQVFVRDDQGSTLSTETWTFRPQ